MKIRIRVKPNSRQNEVLPQDDGSFVVRVNVPPKEGKANLLVIELLAKYFNQPQSTIHIIMGKSSRSKLVEIEPLVNRKRFPRIEESARKYPR